MRFFESLAHLAEGASRRIGDAASWLLLAVAGAGVAVLLLRHVLGSGSVAMPPAYVWCTALVVLAGGGMGLKREAEEVLLLRFLSPKGHAWLKLMGALCVVLPWAALFDLFAGSLSLAAPGLIGEPSGTLENLWWRLAVDVGAVTLGLEGLGLFAQGLAELQAAKDGGRN